MNEDEEGSLPIGLASLPDQILPSQFFDTVGGRRFDNPEQNLLFAVLVDAIHCWRNPGCSSRTERNRHEAGVWLFTPKLKGGLSFELVCEGLGIAAEWLRMGLRAFHDDVNMARRHLVHTERRSHPVEIRKRVRHDYRHVREKRAHLPFVPI